MPETPRRFEYILDLKRYTPRQPAVGAASTLAIRHPSQADLELLAVLMLDAYHATIDYDGETIVDARHEVATYFAELDAVDPVGWLACSFVAESGMPAAELCGACLVSYWQVRQAPLIAYVMTAAAWKRREIAALLLRRSLSRLKDLGYSKVHAVITQGNTPSEALFTRLGFERVNE